MTFIKKKKKKETRRMQFMTHFAFFSLFLLFCVIVSMFRTNTGQPSLVHCILFGFYM